MNLSQKWVKIIFTLLLCLKTHYLNADNRIIIQLRHAPDDIINSAQQDAQEDKTIKKINSLDEKTPGEVSKKLVKNGIKAYVRPTLSGFMAIYGGYLDISDHDGLITFPLRHASEKIYLAVTPDIKLINVKDKTFSHHEFLRKNNPTELYLLEKKEDDKEQPFWNTKKIKLPKNNRIAPISVVLLTKPKNVAIVEGDSLATANPQLVLPPVYVISTLNHTKILLKMLDLKQFFETINIRKKSIDDEGKGIQKMITNV